MKNIQRCSLYLLISLIIVFSSKLIAQTDTVYFKVNISNMNPAVNELVTVTLEFELSKDYNPCHIMLGLIDSGVFVITGDKSWTGTVHAGEKIERQYLLKFTQASIYNLGVRIFQLQSNDGFGKIFKIHVGGAFKENEKVQRLKDQLQVLNNAIYNPGALKPNFMINDKNGNPESAIISIPSPDKLEKYLAEIKDKETDPELKRKNDSLYTSLKEEYKKLYREYQKKDSKSAE